MDIYFPPLLLIPLVLTASWLYTAHLTRTHTHNLPFLQNKRICLLIAHPDDEAMFFSPTLLALTNPVLGNHIKILCLSSGDAEGLGEVRTKELGLSAMILGLRDRSKDILVLEDSEAFPDRMDVMWSKEKIAGVLDKAFNPNSMSPTKMEKNNNNDNKKRSDSATAAAAAAKQEEAAAAAAAQATIDILITFDPHGISSHPNHISLHHGAKAWLSGRHAPPPRRRPPSSVTLYTLTTTNIIRKYTTFLDGPLTFLIAALRTLGATLTRQSKGKPIDNYNNNNNNNNNKNKNTNNKKKKKKTTKREEGPPSLVFISNISEYRKGQDAMVRGHKSQMRWFRWGWIVGGRYMVVNDLKREREEEEAAVQVNQ